MRWRSPAPVRHPPGFIEPCLPTLGHTVPTGPQRAYKIKHDGFRFICRRDGDRVRVFSRRGNDFTDRVPLIAEALAKLPVKSVTIDGEGVACGAGGVSDFDRLRAAVGRKGARDAFLYAPVPWASKASSPSARDRPYQSGRSADWIRVKNPAAPAANRVIEG
jgi:bifunctional non-homologous end joining protein LigD